MKRALSLLLCAAMLTLTACGRQPQIDPGPQQEEHVARNWEGANVVELSDESISVTIGENTTKIANQSAGQTVACNDESGAAVVSVARDIVYYEEGHDFTYGEGTEADAHSAEEAAAHTVVTIQQPGTYVLRGKLSAGQVAVDLGEDAAENPGAVVTLVLDGVDLTCTVAPAVIFYNVYECGDKDTPTRDVDTSTAGANVIIADGTKNHIYGSYVARIYKPGTVELNEDGTEVAEAKKLHKYDGAFYSKMSMNVSGESGNSGVLSIKAENEGLDSEMHLTINSGTISIISGNDGINTNEDGVSVTTINGGDLYILVAGTTGEGDGIDSNGWLVINGGTVETAACSGSADAGIDSDMGIHIGAGAAIISTGIPQPNPESELLRELYDDGFEGGTDAAYTYPGFRRVLQAAGRVIRTETDRGVVLLLDQRYGAEKYQELMPSHWRLQKISSMSKLNFQLNRFWES